MTPRRIWLVMLFLFPVIAALPSEARCGQAVAAGGSSQAGTRLSLEEAIRLALAHNRTLRAQRLAIDQAKADEITAALKPNPVFSSVNEDFPIFNPHNFTLGNLRTNQEFTDSVTYTLERGDKRMKRVQVAQDSTDVVVKTVADNERQVRFQVVQDFINLLLAKSNLEFALADREEFARVVEINKQRLQAGDIAEGDYLKMTLQMLQFDQDVSAANLALLQGKAALRQLVGYETVPEDFEAVGRLDRPHANLVQAELESSALLTRPDYLAAQSAVKLANDAVTLSLANRARDLTLESEYKRSGSTNGVGFGLSIEIPIHDRNQGEIAHSRAAARQAAEAAEAVRIGVLTDVRSGWAGYRTNEEVVSFYESGYLDQASQSREISRYAYQRGSASLLDLLDAERSYRGIQLAYRQALASLMMSLAQLNFAVGKQVSP
jgi:cobalt-zinc-cadmium efflux system outer membrane protein